MKQHRSTHQCRSGFTLIELLVALGLMALLMVIIATMFRQTSSAYTQVTEIMQIESNTRSALDFFVRDLNGCLPLEGDQQRFKMENGGADDTNARDSISFRASALTSQGVKGVEVTYFLQEDDDPTILAESGSEKVAKTKKTNRTLYVLRRKTTDYDGNSEESTDLCHYVLAFNIEFFDSTDVKYKEISEGKFTYPIGDANPTDEKLPRAIRVTLRVVANAAERIERAATRIISIPMGQ